MPYIFKKILIILFGITFLFVGWFLLRGNTSLNQKTESPSQQQSTQPTRISEKDKPQIVSTKPDPLEEAIVFS